MSGPTLTRRELLRRAGRGAAAGFVISAAPMRAQPSTHRGVTLGVQSYSFRDRGLDEAIAAMRELGLVSCELWQGHVEPRRVARDDLRRWRETVSLDEFGVIKDKLARAKVALSAYNISFRDDFSDDEIERAFAMARALGAPAITASANTAVVARVAKVATRERMLVAVHNHSRIDANEFATPASFTTAMAVAPSIAVNLDIGHFTAANFDAVTFLRQHHARIVTLHLKDRRRNDGPNVPFGEGDTPIGAVLRLLRDQAWAIPANIEYEYKGGDTVQEVRRCLEFCRRELDS
jgi:sugar phosphate isomerase/epimerase